MQVGRWSILLSRESPRVVVAPETVRRLAVTKQHLVDRVPRKGDSEAILSLVRDIGCIQFDPINVIAPSHLLVLWSRLGHFDKSKFESLLYRDRKLFEYWAHQASIVLTEDYPLYYPMMKGVPGMLPRWFGSTWYQRTKHWIEENSGLKKYVLKELRERGP